ncbi:mechanosensitive ion channel family protein [Hwanghaeella sp.]|uniref:mechanosensitive ion channel family protein n=1 Tax=Hwanghaeella sp. TaxID=2605943 RepID=UPI003CCC2B3A
MADRRERALKRRARRNWIVLLARFVVTVLLYVLYEVWHDVIPGADPALPDSVLFILHQVVGVFLFIAGAMTVNFALRHYFWHGWVEARAETQVPSLLVDISAFAVWVAGLIATLSIVFDVSVSAFVTTSGIVIAVIGFALRYMISDVFTGIALGLERPINIGDWVQLEDGTLGKVVEINWRATKLITKEQTGVVVPNTFLATHPFTNFNWPEDYFRAEFDIVLDYEVTSHQAERILLSAVTQVEDSTALPRQPDVRIKDYTPRGIKWQVRYWVPSHEDLDRIRYQVKRNILRNLHFAGLRVPHEKLDLLNSKESADLPSASVRDVMFLRDVHLFDSMNDEELQKLRNRMRERLCIQGEAIVRQGEEGDSLFLLREGYLDVFIDNDDGDRIMVGHLLPGMFFGEMSLLTGARRAATVIPSVDAIVFQISKEDIRSFLEESQDLVRQLSLALAERQMMNDRKLTEGVTEQEIERVRQTAADRLFQKIQGYFGLMY